MVRKKSERPREKGPVPDAYVSCNPIGDKEMCSHAFGSSPNSIAFSNFYFPLYRSLLFQNFKLAYYYLGIGVCIRSTGG